MRGVCLQGQGVGNTSHRRVVAAQEGVGAVLDPGGHLGVGGSAVGRVVLEAAILGRVVRGSDDDAVGQTALATAVMHEDGPGNHRGRCDTIVYLNDHIHAIGRQNLQGGTLGGRRDRVCVLAHVQRAIDPALTSVVANRLGNRQDVGFRESTAKRRAPVPAGAEGDELILVAQIGSSLVIFLLELRYVDQHFRWGRFAGKWGNRHVISCFCEKRRVL